MRCLSRRNGGGSIGDKAAMQTLLPCSMCPAMAHQAAHLSYVSHSLPVVLCHDVKPMVIQFLSLHTPSHTHSNSRRIGKIPGDLGPIPASFRTGRPACRSSSGCSSIEGHLPHICISTLTLECRPRQVPLFRPMWGCLDATSLKVKL